LQAQGVTRKTGPLGVFIEIKISLLQAASLQAASRPTSREEREMGHPVFADPRDTGHSSTFTFSAIDSRRGMVFLFLGLPFKVEG